MDGDDSYFVMLRGTAEKYGLKINSMFSAYREFGGFFYDHPAMEKASRTMYEKYIRAAGILGLDYAGTIQVQHTETAWISKSKARRYI